MSSLHSAQKESTVRIQPHYLFTLFVFSFALVARVIVFLLGVASEGNFNPPSSDFEAYQDFRILYLPLVEYFKAGLMPYEGFPYAYPPFFLYLLTLVGLFSVPDWGLALPMMVFDAASAVLVFLIASRFMTPKKALIASIAFALAPINLYYYDYLWLNSPPMMFFTLLAVYAFLSKRYGLAFYSLAVATLFKQIAIVLLPVFAVTLLNESNRRQTIVNVAIFGTTCFLGSLPYIVTIPTYYFSNVAALWSSGPPEPTLNISIPISLATVFGMDAYYGASTLISIALLLSIIALCWRIRKTRVVGDVRFVTYVLYALLLFHVFLPRGMYKYYIAYLTPFIAIFIRNMSRVIAFFGLNLLVLMISRILTPWVLVALLALPLVKAYVTTHPSSRLGRVWQAFAASSRKWTSGRAQRVTATIEVSPPERARG